MTPINYQNQNASAINRWLRSAVLVFTGLTFAFNASAQTTVTIGAGSQSGTQANSATGDCGPMYRSTNASNFVYSRHHYLYTAAELAAAGIPSGNNITKLAWNNQNGAGTNSPCIFQIWIKNSSLTDVGAGGQAWATLTSGSTLVYNNSSHTVPAVVGWHEITLGTPFLYTGGALEISVNFDISQGVNPWTTAGFSWFKDPITGRTLSYVGSTAPSTTLPNLRTVRAQIQITYGGGSSCTTPPTAGTSTATPSSGICAGVNIALNLTGNSTGSGQTYQWQSSSVIGGPYSNLGSSQSSPALTTPATVTLYYRCAVTCSGNTQTSTPVLVTVNSGLSGTYTINSAVGTGGTNFQTFNAAIAALSCGISAPVVFNVAAGSGPYNEQIDIPAIGGSSITNTITFNCNNVTMTYDATSALYYATLNLSGVDYIVFNNLNVIATGAANAWGIHFMNASDNNTFNGCTSTVSIVSTSTSTQAVVMNASNTSYSTGGSGGNSNTFTNCTFTGGYYGVVLYGASGAGNTGNIFTGCSFKESYTYSTYNVYSTNGTISNCIMERPTRTSPSTGAGVYFTTGCANMLVEKNKVRNMFGGNPTSTGTCYGFACIIAATAGNENKFYNNVVSDINFNGAMYGLYFSGATYIKAYHNTLSLDHTAASGTTTTYGVYATGATSVDIRNNIVTISRGGTGTKYCVYYSSPAGVTSNYNDLFMNAAAGTNNVGYNGTAYSTLAAWQSGSGKDANSNSINPLYSSPGTYNYTPTTLVLDNTGFGLGVTTDILGSPRDPSTPDPGAYEFSVSGGMDIGAQLLVTPLTTGCYTNVQTIVVRIKNYGSLVDFSTTPATVTCDVTGTTAASLSATLSSGTLAVNGTLDVPLTGTFDMSTNGGYTFNAYTVAGSDGNTLNDAMAADTRTRGNIVAGTLSASQTSFCLSGTTLLTLAGSAGGDRQWQSSTISASGPWTNVGTGATTYSPVVATTSYFQVETSCMASSATSNVITVTVNNPQITGTTPGSHCGTGTVTLGATGTGSAINWYTAPSGGSPVSTGASYTTPVISSNTTYYASASSGGFTGNVGKLVLESTASGTGGGLTTYMNFDAISNFTLQTVTLYPYGATDNVAGTVTIELRTSTGTPIMSQLVNVIGHNSFATSVPQVVTLNFPVTGGASYRLGVNAWTGGVSNLWRDATGTYPYTLPGVASITGPSLAPYYYFFYNWSVSTGCESARSPVLASITTAPAISPSTTLATVCNGASTNLNVSSSNAGYTYTWTPGNLTGASVSVNPTATTTYTVTAVDNSAGPFDGCGQVATVAINALPASVTATATPSGICGTSGTTVVSLTPATGYPAGTIQWQSASSAVGPYSNIGGATSPSYSSPTLSSTTYYKALIMDGNSNVCLQPTASVVIGVPSLSSTSPDTRCGTGTVTLGATPSAGATVNWYIAPSGGTPVFTGSPFTTPTISNTTTYYASATSGGSTANVGYVSGIPLGTSGVGITNYGVVFDALTSFTLYSVTVFPVAAANGTVGNITVGLYSTTGALLQSAVVSVTGNLAASVTAQTVTLNFNIVPGTNYKLAPVAITGSGITGLLFQPSASAPGGNWGYPFTVPGVVSITTSTLTAAPTNTPRPDLYYYFYNWTVSSGCESARQAVVATVTPAPAITVSTTAGAVCSGSSADIGVTSGNDPGYTYSWTSSPASPGFPTTGPGPITVSPTVTTIYTVTATDNSGGANQGCVETGSVTIVTGILSAGTIASTVNNTCTPTTPTISVAGASGGVQQWQESTVSASGPWTNVGSGGNSYTPSSPVTVTHYYQLEVTCGATTLTSNVVTVVVVVPQITGTTPASRCGAGTVTVSATAAAGANISWYAAASGGTALANGGSYSPIVTGTTTYYVEANNGGGSPSSPLVITEMDLGTDRLEITNVSGAPLNVAGWKVAVSNSYTAITSVNANIQTLSGSLAAGATFSWTDAAAGPNYWGSNILWNPGAYPTYTGWAAILDASNNLVDIVFMNWPAANIQAASIVVGTATITVGTKWVGNGINTTTVAATNGVSRQGATDNNSAADFAIIPLSIGSVNPGMTVPFTGQGCYSARQAVPVNVTPAPSVTVTSSTGTSLVCVGQSATLTASSSNPGYTYTWMPGSLTGSSVIVTPTSNTTYSLTAVDNSGGIYNLCGAIASVAVNGSASPAPQLTANSNAPICEGNPLGLTSSNNASGQSTGNSYAWSGPSFASTLQNPSVTGSATLSQTGTYTVTITNSFGCTASTSTVVAVNANPTGTAAVTAASCNGLCDGGVVITPTAGQSPYIFTDGVSVNTDGIFTGTYCAGPMSVDVFDDNGCTANIPFSVTEPAVLAISSTTPVDESCAGLNNGSITVAATGGTTSYFYSKDNGSSFQSSNIFNGLAPGNYDIVVKDAHDCITGSTNVTIAPGAPLPSATISGSQNICQPGGSASLSIAFTQAGPWTYSYSDGTSTFGPFSTSGNPETVNVSPASTKTYTVTTVSNGCVGSTTGSAIVTVSTAPPTTNLPFPTVPAYACAGNNLTASTSPVTNTLVYTWDGPAGTTFNSSGNPYSSSSTSVTVNYGAPNGSGYNICVQGSNACGTTTRRCTFVRGTVNVPGVIAAANNRTTECASTSASYSIAAVTGATGYTWSITGNATVVGSGTSATVNFGAGWTGGTLSVTANTPCFNSAPRSLALSNATATPGAISGSATACPGSSVTYSIPVVAGAATYNWVLPANTTGGSSSNSILVNFAAGYTFGDIKVSITSICGVTSAQQIKTVSSGKPAVPASIAGNIAGLCGQTVVYSCPSVAGASSYTWTSPGTINSGQGSTSINVTFGTFASGNVCVTANNGCGSGTPRCVPLTGKPTAPAVITYSPNPVCANASGVDLQVSPVFGTTGYAWIFPAGVTPVLDLGNEQIVNWGATGGTVTVTVSNACGNSSKNQLISLGCREIAPETEVTMSEVTVYPNPAHDRITVKFTATEKTGYVLNLLDLSGRVLSTTNATAQKGINTSEMDLSRLAKGVYMIEVKSEALNKQIRIVTE